MNNLYERQRLVNSLLLEEISRINSNFNPKPDLKEITVQRHDSLFFFDREDNQLFQVSPQALLF